MQQAPVIVRTETEVCKCLKTGKQFIIADSTSELDLRGCDISAKGCKLIGEAIKLTTSLTYLDIYDNDIGQDGCNWLSKALAVNTSVTHLNLNKAYIGTVGAKYIARALKVNTSLTRLDLYHNFFSNEGCKYLSEALQVNTSLTSLDLRRNLIGSDGFQQLIEALGINKSLTAIHLEDPGLDAEQLAAIKQRMEYNKLYPRNMIVDVLLVLINFARCKKELASLLPLELWRLIFEHVNYPGYERFEVLFDKVLNDIDKIHQIIARKERLKITIKSNRIDLCL